MSANCLVCEVKSQNKRNQCKTCTDCRRFFNNKTNSKHKCQADNKCVIDETTRDDCKACRYRKCLRVGLGTAERPKKLIRSTDPKEMGLQCTSCFMISTRFYDLKRHMVRCLGENRRVPCPRCEKYVTSCTVFTHTCPVKPKKKKTDPDEEESEDSKTRKKVASCRRENSDDANRPVTAREQQSVRRLVRKIRRLVRRSERGSVARDSDTLSNIGEEANAQKDPEPSQMDLAVSDQNRRTSTVDAEEGFDLDLHAQEDTGAGLREEDENVDILINQTENQRVLNQRSTWQSEVIDASLIQNQYQTPFFDAEMNTVPFVPSPRRPIPIKVEVKEETIDAANEYDLTPHYPDPQAYRKWNAEEILAWARSFVTEESFMDYLEDRRFNGDSIYELCTSSDWKDVQMDYNLRSQLKGQLRKLDPSI